MKHSLFSPLFVLLLSGFAIPSSRAETPSIRFLQTLLPTNLPTGISGITYLGDHSYALADDSGGRIFRMTLAVDPATGLADTNSLAFSPPLVLEGSDLEGIAYDPAHRSVYVSDESGATIREFDLATGAPRASVPVPSSLKAFRHNLSLESLSLHASGLHLWTSNEEALCNPKLGIDDGPTASSASGTVVRLTRFTRASLDAPWVLAGQWPYLTDPIGGKPFRGLERSGVSDLCALPDGTLLVLERELSLKGKFPSFRIRLYHVQPASSESIHTRPTLADRATFRPLPKKLLYSIEGPFSLANIEGLCLGPKLTDGTQTLLLCSDADNGAPSVLHILQLTH